MIPEIAVACHGERYFINYVTVGQYRDYVGLMEKNGSDDVGDVFFFNKRILQGMLGGRVSLAELGEMDVAEFLVAVYDQEFGYGEDAEEGEGNVWKTCGEIIDRIVKISIRLMKNSYSQCMGEDILSLLEYLKFELDTLDESQGGW